MNKMIRRAGLTAVALFGLAVISQAAINISWYTSDGFLKSDNSTALLNGGGTALAQLIYSIDSVADPVDLLDAHYVGGDDQWWADVIVSGGGGYGGFSGTYTQSFVSGYYYVRVFDEGSSSSVTQGMWYFNGYTTPTVNNTSEPPQPNEYNIDDTTGAFGERLDLQVVAVPEPTTWAFMGLGALVMFLRRRFAK